MEDNIDKYKELYVLNYISGNLSEQKVSLKHLILDLERDIIAKTLQLAGGNQRRAAEILGIGFSTLNEKIRRFQIKSANPKGDMRKKVDELIRQSLSG